MLVAVLFGYGLGGDGEVGAFEGTAVELDRGNQRLSRGVSRRTYHKRGLGC